MDLQKIEALVRLFESSALGAMDVSEGDFSLSLKRACDPPPAPGAVPMPGAAPAPAPIPAAAPAPAESGRVVKSPLAGVFYAASSPDAAPFVQAGDRVKKGDTLCIIGAGPMGLLKTQIAKMRGARVIMLEKDPGRLAKAMELGADVGLNPAEHEDIAAVVRGMCNDGRGPDAVIEAVGQPATWELAIDIVRKGGIVVEYGGAGARTGQLVADIFDAYFAMENGTLTVDEPETADPAGDDPKTEAVDGDAAADETDTAGETAPAPEPAAAPAA